MKLPEGKREQFKSPKGKLFRSAKDAFDYIDSINPKEIITVGDRVSSDFLKSGYKPNLVIVDYKIRRSPAKESVKDIIENYDIPKAEVKNPAGQISEDLINTIKSSDRPIKIIVDGEEDLAVVPAILHSPKKSVLAYGQPKEGIVIVEITEEKKREFREFEKLFE